MTIINLIKNKLEFDEQKNFTAIIGSNPSSGARSPILWNYAFEKNNIDCKMYCFDVDEHNILKFIKKLQENKFFLGGAIAVPFKEKIFSILDKNITLEAKNIGSINCLFRDNNGRLFGTNTDGEAAVLSLKEKIQKIDNKKILLIGPGGAGKAVSAYLLKSLKNKNNLFITGRAKNSEIFCKRIACKFLEWNNYENFLEEFDIIINCTSLGSGDFKNLSPISSGGFNKIKKNVLIFDIIYDPSPSKLLSSGIKRGFKTLDGKKMNLLQASLAFDYCINDNKNFNTYDLMFEKFNKLS